MERSGNKVMEPLSPGIWLAPKIYRLGNTCCRICKQDAGEGEGRGRTKRDRRVHIRSDSLILRSDFSILGNRF